ncbi:MAG: hypothetical protein AB2L14_11585 [Candidatus Xenobiia bacterium LiM19]
MLFSQEPGGNLKAQLVGQQFYLNGALQKLTWNVEVTVEGRHHGNGVFTFSPDYRSFKGEFTDVSGHHVIWTGSR